MSRNTSKKMSCNRIAFDNPVNVSRPSKHRFNMQEIEKLCSSIADRYSDILSKVECIEVGGVNVGSDNKADKKSCYIVSAYDTGGKLFNNSTFEYLSGVNAWLDCLAGCLQYLSTGGVPISKFFRKKLKDAVYSTNIVKLHPVGAESQVKSQSKSGKLSGGVTSQLSIPVSTDINFVSKISQIGKNEKIETNETSKRKRKGRKSKLVVKSNRRKPWSSLPLFA